MGLTATLLMAGVASPALAEPPAKQGGARPAFDVGDNTLGLCIGFGAPYNHNASNPPFAFAVTFDHGTIGNVGPGTIGFGGILGFVNSSHKHGNGQKQTWTDVIIAGRATYHLTILKDKNNKFDPYGGASVGVRIETSNGEYPGSPGSYSDPYGYIAVFVGAKYNVKPNFGFFSELGNDVAFFKIGVHFNFR